MTKDYIMDIETIRKIREEEAVRVFDGNKFEQEPVEVRLDKIEWEGFYDGYSIVGYGWTCPNCKHFEQLASYFDDTVFCKKCGELFANPEKPEEM